ncbi:hypothetical protein [Noviherbaspirillum galbum]|uniref:DUF3757 domain-containing protein n=1 Tax=Noviherbaspirillum galbum TaxID=2709383 RepID=A0A6B3SYL5_9BURK|nr:hypothetical protein [Noviherbaspirillum galbum]NEX63862.1 hypothetical protein [Noviherbaspirillum galbum]
MRLPAALLLMVALPVVAQDLDARFSCSTKGSDHGESVIYADAGEMRLHGDKIDAFRWESSLFRSTHGFECSIDDGDGLVAESREVGAGREWRVTLSDAQAARERRGYEFARLPSCSIRLEREGDQLSIKPSCPALCGSRGNFTELSVNLKTGTCQYQE